MELGVYKKRDDLVFVQPIAREGGNDGTRSGTFVRTEPPAVTPIVALLIIAIFPWLSTGFI